jgi:hypothetical protein
MPPLLRRAAPIFGLSALGVLALAPTLGGILRFQLEHSTRPVPGWVHSLPMGVLVALSLIQPLVLAGAASVLGAWLAPKLGLRSHLAERSGRFLPELPLALALGAASGAALFALDLGIWKPLVGDALATMAKGAPRASLALTVSGLFYGGCTEEVMMRWGLMTALAAGLRRLTRGGGSWVMWASIGVVAVLFGLGHLPATRALVPLTGALVIRAIVLNGLVGVACGWLFWKRSLESAMAAHAAADTFIAIASTLAVLAT